MYEIIAITKSKSINQPGKAANPCRGQLNRKNVFPPVFFFALTDRASTITSIIIRGCQSGTWSARQKKIRGTSVTLQQEQKKTQRNKTKTTKSKEQ